MPENPFRKFQRADENIKYAKEAFLRAAGWHSVCNTPGSYWCFSKTLSDGRTMICTNVDVALSIEENLRGPVYGAMQQKGS